MKSSAIIKTQKSNNNQLKSTLYLICQNLRYAKEFKAASPSKKTVLRECMHLLGHILGFEKFTELKIWAVEEKAKGISFWAYYRGPNGPF